MRYAISTILFQLFIVGMASMSQASTVIVFHNASDGIILGTDSAVGTVSLGEVKSSRAIPTSVETACKLQTCGRYFIAEAGFGGLKDRSGKSAITLRCAQIGDRPTNIQEFVMAYRRLVAAEINQYVSNLAQSKQQPAANDVLLSTAIGRLRIWHAIPSLL